MVATSGLGSDAISVRVRVPSLLPIYKQSSTGVSLHGV